MVCDWKVADPRHLALEIPMPRKTVMRLQPGFCDAFTWKFSQTLRDSALSEGIYVRMRHGSRYSTSLLCLCFWKEADLTQGQVPSLTKAQRQT